MEFCCLLKMKGNLQHAMSVHGYFYVRSSSWLITRYGKTVCVQYFSEAIWVVHAKNTASHTDIVQKRQDYVKENFKHVQRYGLISGQILLCEYFQNSKEQLSF